MKLTMQTARYPVSNLIVSPPPGADELIVRRAELEDAPALHRLYAEPHIVRATGASHLGSLAETRAWVEEVSAAGYVLVAEADGSIAGALGLRLHHSPVMRHIGEIYRKHGFGEEGLLRGYGYRDGSFVDIMVMARLHGPLAARPALATTEPKE